MTSDQTPPPGPLPQGERGSKTGFSPSPPRGGGRGAGFFPSASILAAPAPPPATPTLPGTPVLETDEGQQGRRDAEAASALGPGRERRTLPANRQRLVLVESRHGHASEIVVGCQPL